MNEGPDVRRTSFMMLHGKGYLVSGQELPGNDGDFRELEQRPLLRGATTYGLVGMGPGIVELSPLDFFSLFEIYFSITVDIHYYISSRCAT